MEVILHITDIHFGIDGANATPKDDRKLWLKSLLGTIKTLKTLEPDWKPTIICLTGDLVWSGATLEYAEARLWLDSLLDICEIPYNDFIMCVGNHEVDRNHAKYLARSSSSKEADITLEPPIKKFQEASFAEYIRFCESVGISRLNFGQDSSYLVGERKIRGLRFLALNTAWYSKDNDDEGKLWLGLPHLKHMDANDQAPLIKVANHHPITIALMHHPERWLHPDEQCTTADNRPNTLDYLAHRCHILLTGHTHAEVRNPDRIATGAHHFTGGATYAGSNYRNCFRLLQIKENTINYRSVESDPSSFEHKWKMSEPKSINIAETDSKPIDSSSSHSMDKDAARASYLQWLVSCHDHIELRGMQHPKGGTVSVPLQQVYLALQADASNPLERAAAKQMMMTEVSDALNSGEISPHDAEQAIWRISAGSPFMPSLESRDRLNALNPNKKHIFNLARAYFNEPSLVILGDPGSGKTTLARWLTLVSAKAQASEDLSVPLSQVDSEEQDETKTISLGLTRLPVLVRVADYAEARSKAENEGKAAPALVEFFGMQKWQGQVPRWQNGHPKVGSVINGGLVNELIQDALKTGRALVILDGLDEIPYSSLRDDIVEEVDAFARLWVPRNPQIISLPHETVMLISSCTADRPGNRLVITSRIAGYHLATLSGNIAHVTVEPMNITSVEKFISHWMTAVHHSLTGANQASSEAADRETLQFLEKLKDPRYLGARQLATNPLLCSLLATLFRQGKGRLPQRRVELYKQAIDKLIDLWLRRERDEKVVQQRMYEMFDILEPIAEHIHRYEPTGLLPETQLERLALQYLAESRNENPLNPSPTTRVAVNDLMRVVRENVGLLAARGDKVYGFLHLTFQEYLAARALLRNPALAASRIAEHLSDARWREVIRLALGEASRRDPKQLIDLVQALLCQESNLQDLLPQAALAIIAALPDIDAVQGDLVEILIDRLIQTYSQYALLEQLPSRLELLLSAFRNLIATEFKEHVETCFVRALNHAVEHPNQAAAAAKILRRLDFYSPKLAAALHRAICHDAEAWHWPIQAALHLGIMPRDGEIMPRLSPAPGSLPFRQALLDEPQLVERIRTNVDWLSLIIGLYGGIGDFGVAHSIGNYHTLAHFLQLEDVERQRYGLVLKEHWGGDTGDFVYNIAVHLDTVGKVQKESWIKPPKFYPELIFRDRDRPLTTKILQALRSDDRPDALRLTLLKTGKHEVDAKLASWVLNTALDFSVDTPLKCQIGRLQKMLVDATVRCGSFLPVAFASLIESMPPMHGWALLEASTSLVLAHGGQPLGLDLWKLAPQIPPTLRPYLLSELLVQYARGWGDDVVYNSAVFADTIQCSPQELIAAYCLTPISAHRHWDLSWREWPMALLPPVLSRENDIPPSVLTSIELLPASLGFLRVWSLGQRLRPLIDANPDIVPDIIAACLGDVGQRSGRTEILEIYMPELLQSRDPIQDALALARAVKNPYYRARALCRMVRHIPMQKDHLLDEAEAAAETIDDPFEQAQVLELLAANQSGKARSRCWHRCREAVIRIADADERARALGRLGLLAATTEAKACFQQALSSTLQIPDEFARGTTLRILAPLLRGYDDLHKAMFDAAARFQDPLLGARAIENWSEVLRCSQNYWSRSAPDHDLWAVLALMARTGGDTTMSHHTMDGLWQLLADAPSPEAAQKLLNALRGERLDCTLAAIQCLDGLLEAGPTDLAAMLMPKLQAKAAEAVPFLERATLSPNTVVSASASLLLAEMRGLSEGIVPGLINALKSRDELTRLRATELLYGGPQEPVHRASVIGKTGLDALFSAAIEADAGQLYVGNAIFWFNERLLYDLGEHIEMWATELNKNADAATAKYALSHIQHLEPQAFQQVLHELTNGNTSVRSAILISMTHLAKWERLNEEAWNALNATMEKLDLVTLESLRYLVFKLEDFRTIALEALQSSTPMQSQIETARQLLTTRHGISFADIFRAPTDERLPKLEAFGKMMYSTTREEPVRWGNNASVAQEGVTQAGFTELLCEWLIVALGENLNDPPRPYYERTALLDLLAGSATAAPASFARCKSLERLQPWLIAVTQAHHSYTGRADAMLLLGYFRSLSLDVLPALRSALADCEPAREAAMEAALMFRIVDEKVLQELIQYLYDESSSLAFAAARLLTTLGRHDKTSTIGRKRILEALAEAVRDPRSRRPLHFDAGLAPAPEVSKLNDFFYNALLKVAGYEMDRRVHNDTVRLSDGQ